MLIDWFTVSAQALNFLVLVWLMKRFLYQPVLHAIDAREQRIAAELADADARQTEAKAERNEFQRKNAEFDRERAGLLGKATDEANTERMRLIDEARQAAEELSTKQQESRRQEVANLMESITRRTKEEVFAISRKALADLVGADLEERLCGVFLAKLQSSDDEVRSQLADAVQDGSEPPMIRSAVDLPPEQQEAIRNVLQEMLSTDVRPRFTTVPGLVGGIELTAGGQKLGWSIADYLKSLEAGIEELVGKPAPPEAETSIPGA